MAQRQYEMQFVLGARLHQNYQATFGEAQQKLSALAKEITAHQRLQRDISGYQKQQQALQNTTRRLSDYQAQQAQARQTLAAYQQQQAQIQDAMAQMDSDGVSRQSQEYRALEQELRGVERAITTLNEREQRREQQIQRTTDRMHDQCARVSEMEQALTDAGVDTARLTEESERLARAQANLQNELRDTAQNAENMGEQSVSAIELMANTLAAAGVIQGVQALGRAYMACVNAAGEFQYTMSAVQSVSGANAAQMMELGEIAKQYGANTSFSAQQSAQAMTYMGMAGWDAQQMISGLGGVLDLAAASGEDLVAVSDIVTDSLTAFGLTAADSGHFADVLAKASTKANTNVAMMGETFKTAAPLAATLGYTVEDVATLTGLMANAGIKGELAGTALKNTFLGLSEGATLTAQAFGEYELSAFHADGTAKGLSATIDELRGVFGRMTEAEKLANAELISGKYGLSGLLAVLNATAADYSKLSDEISNCAGAAQQMAAVRMDNAQGQLLLLQSAWEGLTIAVGEQFTPIMGAAYEGISQVLGGITALVGEHPHLVRALAAGTAAFAASAAAITAYAAAKKAAAAINLAAMLPAAGPWMAAVAAVGALVGGISMMVEAYQEGRQAVSEMRTEIEGLNDAIQNGQAAYADTQASMAATASLAEQYTARLRELEAQGLNSGAAQQEYANTASKLQTILPDLNLAIDEQTGLLKDGVAAVDAQVAAWKRAAMQQAIQEKYKPVLEAQAKVELSVAENIQKRNQATAQIGVLQDKIAAAQKKYNNALAEQGKIMQGENYATEWQALQQQKDDALFEINNFNNALAEQRQIEKDCTNAIREGKDALADLEPQIAEATSTMQGFTDGQGALESTLSGSEGAVDSFCSQLLKVQERYDESYQAALISIQGQYELWTSVAPTTATSIDTLNAAIKSQSDHWKGYGDNLRYLQEQGANIEGLGAMLSTFADGSEKSVSVVAGITNALKSGNTEAVKTMVQNWQNLQTEQGKTADSLAQVQLDISTKISEIVNNTEEQLGKMDMSDKMRAAARSTMDSYVNEILAALPKVQSAFAKIRNASSIAQMDYVAAHGLGYDNEYAVGTNHAARGFALVGEQGPEIVYFRGGEQVLTASQTRKALSLAPELYTSSETPSMRTMAAQARQTYSSAAAPSAQTSILMLSPLLQQAAQRTQPTAPSVAVLPAQALPPAPVAIDPAEANASRAAAAPTIHINIEINGKADTGAAEQLRSAADEIAARVLAAVQEQQSDSIRRAY